jgi:DNA (cytosine-5)-methyltransferase 1
MNVLDLFSGIGGFTLGLERTGGFRTVAFCEREPYCRAVLAKYWPAVPCYDDVRTLTANRLFQGSHGELPDVICGGFPCQDVSLAGYRAGIDADRSGLWSQFARLIREIRPRYAIVENTPGLLSLGMDRVLGDLAEIGYDAEWHCIPAAAAGARHLRERVFIIAATGEMEHPQRVDARHMQEHSQVGRWTSLSGIRSVFDGTPWAVEPELDRVAYGVPDRPHRLRGLGNAIVPQVAEIIGRAIMRTTG